MKKIILPTDFSENAYNAIKYAVQLFKEEAATFYLLHTYTPPVFQVEYVFQSPSQIGLGDPYQMRAIKQLKELKQRLQAEYENPEHHYVTRAAFNTLTDEILTTTRNEKADMVIMGTQGATNTREILLGTNTTQVIRKATCPIIAVPCGFDYVAPKKILFPTDYEINFEKEQLQQLLNISDKHGSNIDVIHVTADYELSENQIERKQKLKHLLNQTPHTFHDLPDQGIIEALNEFQKGKKMNLLIMVRNKHTFFERLFVEPVIKKIGFNIDIPFMVLPYTGE